MFSSTFTTIKLGFLFQFMQTQGPMDVSGYLELKKNSDGSKNKYVKTNIKQGS